MAMDYVTTAMDFETIAMEYETVCYYVLLLLSQSKSVKFFSGTIRNVSIYYVGVCG